MYAYSTKSRLAHVIFLNRCSNRLPLPTYLKLLVAPPLICGRCCKHLLSQLLVSVMPTKLSFSVREMGPSTVPRPPAFPMSSWIISEIFRSRRSAAQHRGVRYWKAEGFLSPMYRPCRNKH